MARPRSPGLRQAYNGWVTYTVRAWGGPLEHMILRGQLVLGRAVIIEHVRHQRGSDLAAWCELPERDRPEALR